MAAKVDDNLDYGGHSEALMNFNINKKNSLSPVFSARKIKSVDRLLLLVHAGGRCEFDGCNKYLLEHHLTLTEDVFGEMAHIVAFRPAGPRGGESPLPSNINAMNNLMLLCPLCHKLIDNHPEDYPRKVLEEYKTLHERRIRYVTDLGPDRKTTVLILKAPIDGQTVAISFDQVVDAVAPRYPSSREGTIIDLTSITDHGPEFTRVAKSTIEERLRRFFEPGGEGRKAEHISVFALGPIPLLVFLGRQLTNKISSDVYQRHRDNEKWMWEKNGTPVNYLLKRRRVGVKNKVALVISLSGKIPLEALPGPVRRENTIYELTLYRITPSPTFLRLRGDLERFRVAYLEALGEILQRHGLLNSIDLFPAVPASAAVLCGREMLPKVHPRLRIFDYDKSKNGFHFVLEV